MTFVNEMNSTAQDKKKRKTLEVLGHTLRLPELDLGLDYGEDKIKKNSGKLKGEFDIWFAPS